MKLARCTGNKSATDFVDDILFAYADILKRCGENGVEWLQVDEPYLVMDLTMGDVALFRKLYQTLLEQKGTVKVLLQTYLAMCGIVTGSYVNCPLTALALTLWKESRPQHL